jgi:methionyl-tRNA synthetase
MTKQKLTTRGNTLPFVVCSTYMQEDTTNDTKTPITGEKEKKEETALVAQAPIFATIDDFQKIEIRVGTVLSVSVVEGADKLFILQVDLGEEKPRQILSGIREYVTEADLLDKQFPFITNLAPRMLRGHESEGMILAGSDESGLALLNPTKVLSNGTRLR